MLGRKWSVLRRPREGCRSLKHGEMSRDLCEFGDDLHARRTIAHNANASAFERDSFFGPQTGLHDFASECVDAWPIWPMRCAQPTSRHDTETRAKGFACLGIDDPRVGLVIKRHRGNTGFKTNVRAKVVTVSNVIEIALDLGLSREVFAPFPFLFEFGIEAERIFKTRNVTARPGIAVPEPRAAYPGCSLEHDHSEPALTENFQRIETRHAGPHDNDVSVQRYVVVPHDRSPELFRIGTFFHQTDCRSTAIRPRAETGDRS